MDWIAITIKPNQSKKAEANLQNQGFATFFPRIFYKIKNKTHVKDMFSGYAFVRINNYEKLKSINATYGVSKVLSIQNRIPTLSDDTINSIEEQVNAHNNNYELDKTLKINDQVIIKLEIFKNQPAEILNITENKDSQNILLRLLNSSHTIWVDKSLIEFQDL